MSIKNKVFRLSESQYQRIVEFVSQDGSLIKGKKPDGHENEITSDITTDDLIAKTKNKNNGTPYGAHHSLSFGSVMENEMFNSLPQSLIHNINELVNTMKENAISPEQAQMVIQYLTSLMNGE